MFRRTCQYYWATINRSNNTYQSSFLILLFMEGNAMFMRLFQKLVEQIVEGDIAQVRSIIARPGIQAELRESFTELLQVIEQLRKTNETCMNDIYFYRTIIKRLEKGEDIAKQELIDREDISSDKLEEVVKFVGKIGDIRAQSIILPSLQVENKKVKEQRFKMDMQLAELKSKLQENEDYHKAILMSSQQQLKLLREEADKHKEEVKRLEEVSQKMERMMEELENENNEYEKMIRELNITLKEKEVAIKQMKTQVANINKMSSQNMENSKQRLSDLQNSLNACRLENEDLKKEKAAFKPLTQEIKMSLHFGQSLGLKSAHAEGIIQAIQSQIGQMKGLETLFRFKVQKGNFHPFVDAKSNLLFVCLTESDQIVGAFTSAGFSLHNEPANTKAFLFHSNGDSILTYKLKAGKRSTEYDADFLLFGREELCIERGSLELSSSLMNGRKSEFHYDVARQQCQQFLSGHHEEKVRLQDYELLRVQL